MLFDIHTHYLSQKPSIYNCDPTKQNTPPTHLPYSIGLHPWSLSQVDELPTVLQKIEHYAQGKSCLLIGETGLDRTNPTEKQRAPLPKQIEVFNWHIQLAQRLGKPLIIHCVKSYGEIIQQLKLSNYRQVLILHDFNGPEQVLEDFLRFKSYFSYGDKLFRPKSRGFQTLKHIPHQKLLLESDETERDILEIYQRAASVLNLDLKSLEQQIEKNVNNLFSSQLTRTNIGGNPLYHLFNSRG